MLLDNNYQPKNESKEHYELKQIAKYILKNKGYSLIGEEIELRGRPYYLNNFPQFNSHRFSKSRVDVIGLLNKGCFNTYKEPTFKSLGMESKVSLSDFKNGFCTLCEKTYIISPIGVIPHELIPKNIGLIEVDLDNYTIEKDIYRTNGLYLKELMKSLNLKLI